LSASAVANVLAVSFDHEAVSNSGSFSSSSMGNILLIIRFDSSTVATHAMSQPPPTATASYFQTIFNSALRSYEKQTKKELIAHPLALS